MNVEKPSWSVRGSDRPAPALNAAFQVDPKLPPSLDNALREVEQRRSTGRSR